MVGNLMLGLMCLEDQNKLLPPINFKNILKNQKLRSKKMLLLEFLEFREFQRLLHKLFLSQSQKLLKIQLFKIYLKVTQMEMKMRMLKQWLPQPWKFFQ